MKAFAERFIALAVTLPHQQGEVDLDYEKEKVAFGMPDMWEPNSQTG